MKILNFDDVVLNLGSHLEKYLNLLGIDTSHNIKCINPKHEDSSPSMSLMKNKDYLFCHGCGINNLY